MRLKRSHFFIYPMQDKSIPQRKLAAKEISAVFKKYGLQGGFFIAEQDEEGIGHYHAGSYITTKKEPLAAQLRLILNSCNHVRQVINDDLNKTVQLN
jgi:hypothetical protein